MKKLLTARAGTESLTHSASPGRSRSQELRGMAWFLGVTSALVLFCLGFAGLCSEAAAQQGQGGVYWQCVAPSSSSPSGGYCPVNNTYPLPVTGSTSSAVGVTPTDRTVTSATGSSQTVMAANATRHSMTIENSGNANCGVNPTGGTAVIGGAGTLTLYPGGAYTPRIPTLSAVTAICTAGQPLYADEN